MVDNCVTEISMICVHVTSRQIYTFDVLCINVSELLENLSNLLISLL